MGYYVAGKYWEDKTLWQAAIGKACIELSVSELADMSFDGWNTQTLADVARETKAILNANMNHPVLVTPEHRIMDGCHRVVKAVLDGQTLIKAIILDVSDKDFPKPDYDEWAAVQHNHTSSNLDFKSRNQADNIELTFSMHKIDYSMLCNIDGQTRRET